MRAGPLAPILLCAAVLAGAALWTHGALRRAPWAPSPDPASWNVLMVMVDTLRADHLGTYGYERDTSPSLDAFAAGGVLFEQARSQAGCTFPSVNSLLTSRHPIRFLGQEGGFMGIPQEIPSLARILRRAGHATAAVSASPIVRRSPSRFNPQGGFDGGFESFDESCLWKSARCVDRQAFQWLDEQAAGGDPPRPFLLYLHYMEPHGPYGPPEDHPRRFVRPYEGPEAKDFIARGDPNPIGVMLYGDGPRIDVTPRDLVHLVDLYDEEIAFFDLHFQRLIDGLEARGLWDRTLVVVLADHGEEFLEHGHVKHCRTVFDTLIRTPLIFKIPGARGGARRSEPVQNLDVVPTVLDYLGLLGEADHALEGRSLRPALEGGSLEPAPAFSIQSSLRSVVEGEGRYKLIYELRSRRPRLFDLAADPAETTDLAPDHPNALRRLRRQLFLWMREAEGGIASGESLEAEEEAERQLRALGYLQ